MKIAVIGAGVVGITTAYELACDGHEVTVLERRGAAAEEASFANAGLVTPGYVAPWAAPGMPTRVLRNLLSRHAPVKVGLPLSSAELRWIWQWLRACRPARYNDHRAHTRALAAYSQQRLHHITSDLKLEYERSEGQLVLLRSQRDGKGLLAGLQLIKEAGVKFQELNAQEARTIEPALNPDTNFFGAIHLPGDEVGNCRQFALMLRNEALRKGVKFSFNAAVTQVQASHGVTISIAGEAQPRQFEGAIISAAIQSARLLSQLGLRIPMVAVHGYSVSANIRDPANAPCSAVMDEHYRVAISRLGNRVRVSGTAELGGFTLKKRSASLQTLYKVLHDWFPGAAHLSNGVQEWKGARAMLPDGTPVIGPSGTPGVWLNLAHGSSGWTQSCGAARALADQIGGRKPELDLTGFDVHRLTV